MRTTAQLFKVPEEQAHANGVFVGGGFHPFREHPDHGSVVAMPLSGDYSLALPPLGFQPLGVGEVEVPSGPSPSYADA